MSGARSTSLTAAAVAVLLTAACGERTEPAPAPSPAADPPPTAEQPTSALPEAVAPEAEAPATEVPPAESTPQPAAPPPVVTAPPAKVVEEAPASVRPAAFARCQSCHSVDREDGHGMGPNLAGIMGSRMGSRSGFTYSAAMADSGQTWTPALMDSFLQDPRGTVPGTKMMAAPIRDPEMRQAIIDYLSAN